MAEFRMNEPPVSITNPGYTPAGYVEYPRCLHKFQFQTLVVHNDADKEAALKDGWSLTPVLTMPEEKGKKGKD